MNVQQYENIAGYGDSNGVMVINKHGWFQSDLMNNYSAHHHSALNNHDSTRVSCSIFVSTISYFSCYCFQRHFVGMFSNVLTYNIHIVENVEFQKLLLWKLNEFSWGEFLPILIPVSDTFPQPGRRCSSYRSWICRRPWFSNNCLRRILHCEFQSNRKSL